uniref:Uncharacterized protein n=1 Tax=Oryza sativa subsp. japonica TaxID=39947 RepID=Q6ERB9_ORYSJ|nr:hypothetical protein [Oryza sativa Japonica Group]
MFNNCSKRSANTIQRALALLSRGQLGSETLAAPSQRLQPPRRCRKPCSRPGRRRRGKCTSSGASPRRGRGATHAWRKVAAGAAGGADPIVPDGDPASPVEDLASERPDRERGGGGAARRRAASSSRRWRRGKMAGGLALAAAARLEWLRRELEAASG